MHASPAPQADSTGPEGGVEAISEPFFRRMLDALPSQIAIVDAEGTIIAVNAAWQQFGEQNGYRANQAGIGTNYLAVCDAATGRSAEEAAPFAAGLRAVLTGQQATFWLEYPCHSPTERRWFQARVTRAPGTPVRVAITHQNVTELKLTQEELTRSNAELQQFTHTIAHDLREPLRMVHRFVELLQMRYADQIDQRGQEYMHQALDAASRMQQLISDLLDYSRIGAVNTTPIPTSSAAALATAMADLRLAIRESGAIISNDPLPTVLANPPQLVRLFSNLLANAIKFRSAEPPRIHIGVQPLAGHWRFSISDNGIGIPAAQAKRVFTIFQRLHGRSHYPGNGIGLALCKRIVERYGGNIWVEPQATPGTTIMFSLPMQGAIAHEPTTH